MNNILKSASLRSGFFLAIFSIGLVFALTPSTASADNHEEKEESELYQKMEEMQGYYRNLGRGLRRPSADDLPEFLNDTQQLQLLTVQTKSLIPSKTAEIPEDERSAFILAYRQLQLETLRTLIALEEALLEADFEAADAVFDEVKKLRSEGHEAFKSEDD